MSSRSRSRVVPAALVALAVVVVVVLGLTVGGPVRPRQRAIAASSHGPPSGPTRSFRRFTIGHSVQQRRIDAIELAARGAVRSVLLVGCIHGNESAGIEIVRSLARMTPPRGSALWIVPDLNPDGVAAGTRQNARGVDLNRNFPWQWRPLGKRGDLQYSGLRSLSEPESRAAYRLILRVRPQVSIWFHQPEALVDLSGGDPAIERGFARLAGLRLRRLERYPGSAVSWENSLLPGSTAFVVELPPGPPTKQEIRRYTHAVLTLAGAATSS